MTERQPTNGQGPVGPDVHQPATLVTQGTGGPDPAGELVQLSKLAVADPGQPPPPATPSADTTPRPDRALTKPDPDLARVVAAWPALPEPLRRAVLALVDSQPPG